MSSDADVIVAQGMIDAARMAVLAGTMLTESQKAMLNGEIALAELALGTKRTEISNYKTHQSQLTAANGAVDAAMDAVAGLNVDSSDTAVEAAEDLVAVARKVVSDGTMLTADQKATLNAGITAAETSLGTVKREIALRKERDALQQIVHLQGEATGATDDAGNAQEAAEQAVKDASKYAGLIGTRAVHGESMTAQENAQKVLDAKDTVDQAVTDAEAAKTAAETAKTEAEGIPEGTEGRSALIARRSMRRSRKQKMRSKQPRIARKMLT